MKNRRLTFYTGLGASVLLLFVMFAWQQLASARAGAFQSSEDLKACRVLAARIESLQQLPAQAALHEIEKTELDKQMEAAGQSAGLPSSALVAITPDLPHQVGIYQEQSTDVLLKDVALPQLVDFLYNLSTKNSALKVTGLRLTAPREPTEAGRWTAHVTVSYRFYSPKTRSLQGTP